MILVFDFETTGLTLHPDAPVEKQPKAIEFGGALLNPATGAVEEEVSIMINPGEPLSEEIIKITGITDSDLVGAAPFIELLPQFTRVFGAATAVVAHNLPFDRAILRGELARNNVTAFPWPSREMCTVGIYNPHWGRNPRLTELYEMVMGRPLAQKHRALDDVLALVEIIHKEELWKFLN